MNHSSAGDERIAAHRAGLSTFRVGPDKRPLVSEWKSYQEEPPDEVSVLSERASTSGYAIVCGKVSSNLVVFDFEGSFGRERWAELIADNPVLENWAQGYSVSTPHQGIHIAVHVEGDCPHNTKLAFAEGKVIAEIRGEGGYVVGPGSNGDGPGWRWLSGDHSSINYATVSEVNALINRITVFDETPEPAPVPQPPVQPFFDIGDSWISRIEAEPMAQLLERFGWTLGRVEAEGTLVCRPGKDPRDGHSGRINLSDRLLVWSTNAEPVPASRDGRQTYDWVDVVGCYALGRLPSLPERTEILRLRRPASAHPGGEASAAATQAVGATDSIYLPDDFWQSLDWLIALRDESLIRLVSPDAVLGALISAYMTTVPAGIRLPGIVSTWSALNYYSILVAHSGGGKTSAIGLAEQLLGWHHSINPDILLGHSLRSGEGLPMLVIKPPPRRRKGDDDYAIDPSPTYRNGVQVCFDEGGVLAKQGERSGSTALPYLNTAWAGHGMVGGAKAGELGGFPAELVRVCAVIGVQYGAAAGLFTGEAQIGGFPQRCGFYGLDHPAIQTVNPDVYPQGEAGSLGFPWYHPGDYIPARYLDLPSSITGEVRRWTKERRNAASTHDPYDSHQMLLRLRTAAFFALTDRRFTLSDRDWDLATQVETTSRSIRMSLLASLGDLRRQRSVERGRDMAVMEDARDTEWLRTRALNLARLIAGYDEGMTKTDVKYALNSRLRKRKDDILTYAIGAGWVERRDDRFFGGKLPGGTQGGTQ